MKSCLRIAPAVIRLEGPTFNNRHEESSAGAIQNTRGVGYWLILGQSDARRDTEHYIVE